MATNGKIKIEGDATEVVKMFKQIQSESGKTNKVVNVNTTSMSQHIDHFSNNIQKAGQLFLTMAKKAKSLEQSTLQMKVLERTNKDVYNQLLKTTDASFGLANATDMVASANKALSFGIDLSNGRLTKLTRLTTKVASVMGTDAKNAFDDLIVGIARGSKQILDNLGIMVDITQINKDYANQLGISVTMLTKQQKQVALTDEAIKQLSVTTENVTDKMVESNTKASKGLKKLEKLYDDVTKSMLAGYHDLSEGSRNWGGDIADNQISLLNYIPIFGTLKQGFEQIFGDAPVNYNEFTRELTKKNTELWDKYVEGVKLARKELNDEGIEDSTTLYINRTNTSNKLIELNEKLIREKKAFLNTKAGKKELKLKQKILDDANRLYKRNKDKVINDIIALDKELDGYNNLNHSQRLKKDAEYAIERLDLNKDSLANLKRERLIVATDADEANAIKNKNDEILLAEENFNNSMNELLKRNVNQRKFIANEELKNQQKIISDNKKQKEKEISLELSFNRMKEDMAFSGIEATLNAVLSGNAKGIPLILAQMAQSEGTKMFMHGLRVFWAGLGENALIPGSGAVAMAVGTEEMLLGGAMAGGGTLGSYALGGDDTGGSTDSAKSEGATDRMDTQKAIDRQKESEKQINVYQYADEKTYLQHLAKSNNQNNNNRRN